MAFKYLVEPNSADSHQSTPYWLAVVEPFVYRDTYNRDNDKPGSTTDALADPVKTGDIIVIDNDCINWQVSSSKGSPVSGLQMSLRHTTLNYARRLAPEDWIMFFAFDNYKDYQDMKAKIKNFERLTTFKTAPKFIGRIASVFSDKQVDAGGRRQLMYTVSANGFTELNAKIYYNPTLHQNLSVTFDPHKNFGNEVNRVILTGLVSIDNTFIKLIEILLGMGPGKDFTNRGGVASSPNEAYLIPKAMSRFIAGKAYGETFYSDILNPIVGIQKYSDQNNNDWVAGFIPEVSPFISKLISPNINFNNNPIWSILNSVSGYPINEMYTCLKVDRDGHVKPTLVCRQLPFSTEKFVQSNQNTTAFLSLPRWVISDKMIMSVNTGRSNANRYNYVQIVGVQMDGQSETIRNANINATFPPIWDTADIKRAGLSTNIRNVGMFFSSVDGSAPQQGRFWNKLMADITFGSHLKYSGTIISQGIQLPICEGDNCVVDGIIYHIERVAHSGSIESGGKKIFTTTLSISSGISEDSDGKTELIYPDSQGHTFVSGHVGFDSEVE